MLVDGVREHQEIAQLAGPDADVFGQQGLGLEAELAEHGDQRLLVGDDLDHELGEVELEGLEDGMAREQPPDALPAPVWRDHQAHLANMAGPAVQRHDRDVAGNLTVVGHRDRPRVPGPDPGRDHLRVGDVLLQEGAIRVGDGREEPLEGGAIGRLDAADVHPCSFVSGS